MSNTIALRAASAPQRSLPALVGNAVSQAYAYVVATLSSVMRPQAESPAESASRLRTLAEYYSRTHPSHAADLRAAADRSEG